MKKLVAFILTGLLVVTLTGCGEKAATNTAPSQDTAAVEETVDSASEEEVSEEVSEDNSDSSDAEENQSIEVDKNLFDVDITIPASFFEGDEEPITQEALDQRAAEDDGMKSATLNPDGSVTYKVTKDRQKEMLSDLETNINAGIQDMIDDESTSYTEVTYNSNYTEFEVLVDADELNLMDSMYVMAFYMYGGYYNAFAGNTVDDIVITFKNATSGEVISTASYAAFIASQTE